jgi:hypothetical protein
MMDAVAIAVAVLAHEWGDDDLALHRWPHVIGLARRRWPFGDKD